jgi:hypothetical protein
VARSNTLYKGLPTSGTGRNNVAIAGSLIGLLSLFFGWLTLKPNRLAAGTSLNVWDSVGTFFAIIIILLWLGCLTISFFDKRKINSLNLGILANLVLIVSLVLAGATASEIVGKSPEFTRVS